MNNYRRWASEEEQYIRDHWKTQSDAEMATALKRMEGAVRTKRRQLRCSPQRTWTAEEEQYLEDHWGTVSIPGIAKKLERTVSAIKVRAERLGLGGVLDSGDYVTFNQLMLALTDNAQSYSYQMESWVRRRGFPIHTKRVDKCVWRVVYNGFVNGHFTLRRAIRRTKQTQDARLNRKFNVILNQRINGKGDGTGDAE